MIVPVRYAIPFRWYGLPACARQNNAIHDAIVTLRNPRGARLRVVATLRDSPEGLRTAASSTVYLTHASGTGKAACTCGVFQHARCALMPYVQHLDGPQGAPKSAARCTSLCNARVEKPVAASCQLARWIGSLRLSAGHFISPPRSRTIRISSQAGSL